MNISNIFAAIPEQLNKEAFETLVQKGDFKIERIVSKGHVSPESDGYDQDQDEWVIVVQGQATVAFEDGRETHLNIGDFINIPAHSKHKVSWTTPTIETIWLAVFY